MILCVEVGLVSFDLPGAPAQQRRRFSTVSFPPPVFDYLQSLQLLLRHRSPSRVFGINGPENRVKITPFLHNACKLL